MDLPPFEPWIPWTERQMIGRRNRPGVYLLARFDGEVPRAVDPADTSILYIGETCGHLEKRWRQFHRAAFERKHGHSGGLTFGGAFGGAAIWSPPAWLHLAAMPIDLDEPYASAFIRYVERRLIWEYVQRHGAMPPCNSK